MEKIVPVKVVEFIPRRGGDDPWWRVFWADKPNVYSVTPARDELGAFQWAMSETGQKNARRHMWMEAHDGENTPG